VQHGKLSLTVRMRGGTYNTLNSVLRNASIVYSRRVFQTVRLDAPLHELDSLRPSRTSRSRVLIQPARRTSLSPYRLITKR
jgi:predicted nuclease with RNAse H fold